MPALIEASGLQKHFGKTTALAGIDLELPEGEITAILGPNGAGKTTLVRAVATLLRPDAGRLLVLGHDTVRESIAVRRLIGLAGQSAAVELAMTGRENLAMVARLYGARRSTARAAAERVLSQLGLDDAGDRLVRTYSGGMRRRLDLGASLVGSPRLLLLDEPTSGLDPRSRIELWDSIRVLGANGTDVVLTTQYLDEADQLAARIVIIDQGRVIAEGSPGELKSQAGTDRVELRTRDGEGLLLAVATLAGLGDGAPEIDAETHRFSVAASDGPGSLAVAATRLTEAGIEIEDLTLRRPTLDEVFLSLTGHAATTDKVEKPRRQRRGENQ
jgi:ABC-2 type transport system ATP-binding protein